MLTLNEIVLAYTNGKFTEGEVIISTVCLMRQLQPEFLHYTMQNLSLEKEFETWLNDILAGAKIMIGGQIINITDELHHAIIAYLKYLQLN